MSTENQTRVAELLFEVVVQCDFVRAVLELHETLRRVCGNEPALNWDCEDIAYFDMPGTRILLSQSESPYDGYATRLTVAVGPSPIAPKPGGTMVHSAVCARLVERLKARCKPDEIRWNVLEGIITAEDVDLLCERMSTEQLRPTEFETSAPLQDDAETKLRDLRTKLHPYRENEDLPAALTRVANSSIELLSCLATLPSTALYFAAHLYRADQR